MMPIEIRTRPVFYAPTARRHFMTKRAAARAEASALITRKYPTERLEADDLGVTSRGWHWSEDERLVRVHARLSKRLFASAALTQEDA